MRSPWLALLVCAPWAVWAQPACDTKAPENLAPKATITANSEYSAAYLARFVADGAVPEPGSKADPNKAWCVRGDTHRDGAVLTFVWPQPVTIAEVVYYGRVAWFAEECWRSVELYADAAGEPCAKAELVMAHGPQRIPLREPVRAAKLTLKFTASHGGLNPGANEIQVWDARPADAVLGKLVPLPRGETHAGQAPEIVPDSAAGQALRARLVAGEFGCRSLVVIQRRELNPTHVYTYHVEGFQPGGGLWVYTPQAADGELRRLVDSPQGQVLDADLSYDGRTVLFSWRRSAADTYHLFTIDVDGQNLRQLTSDAWHDFNACWLPDGGIGFLSTRKPQFAYCWTSPVGTLYRMNRDGTGPVRLSANYLNDFTPAVLNDGRLIYGRWEYVDRPAIPIQSLWTLNPDGTHLSVFFGNRVLSPATFIEPRPIPGSQKILCTLTAHNGPCRGAIGLLDPSVGVNAQDAIVNLTPEVNIGKVDRGDGNHVRGPYESPYPLDGRTFLVSKRGTLLARSFDGTAQTVLLAPRDGLGFYSAQPVRPRQAPPARPSTLPEKSDDWATVYLQDVYKGLEPTVARGEVKELAVVQEIEKGQLADLRHRVFGFQFPAVSCGATYAPKKVWGFVPVAADGSALFKAPAGVPLYFLALDAQGRAVQRMRSFTHFMPGEVQGCVGCHESRRHAPARNPRTVAARELAAAAPPTPPEWGLAGFSFAHVVQPVLDRHCVGCHHAPRPPKGVDLGGDRTDFFNVAYETLARTGTVAVNPYQGGASGWRGAGRNPWTSWIPTYNGTEDSILLVAPRTWGSPVSKLAELVLAGHPDADGRPRVKLATAEQRRILMWIDLNVPYYGTSLSNYHNRDGCRKVAPADLDAVLQSVGQRRCASCHKPDAKGRLSIPRTFYTRITNPQLNSFLTAPLAKAAGGSEACGQAVFATRDDPDYQALLATFEPVRKELEARPREDLIACTDAPRLLACPVR